MTNTVVKNEGSITFAVHDVVPATKPLGLIRAHEAIDQLLESTEFEESEFIFSCSGYNSRLVSQVVYHPLLQSVHMAFSEHRALVLSPDIIWIAVMQGLAQHVCNNVERLRPKLVKHARQFELAILTTLDANSPESDWAGLARDFSQAIERQIGSEKHARLINDFTTTGELERTVCAVALMDIFQHYYEYTAYCVCGIPFITLEGAPSDWQALRSKIEILSDFEMDFWLPHLRTIMDQFERASRGDIDLHHWRNIYKIKKAYGWDKMNGWFGQLVPYVKDYMTGNFSVVNPLFALDYLLEEPEQEQTTEYNPMFSPQPGITSRDVPAGISAAPFKLVSPEGSMLMQFLGGFLGVEQDSELRLKPRLGWAVRKSPPSANFLEEIASSALINPQPPEVVDEKLIEVETKTNAWGSSIPGDIPMFYKKCDGLNLAGSIGKFRSVLELDVISRPLVNFDLMPKSEQEASAEDARVLELSSNCEEQEDLVGDWLRFFDFEDGSYLAIAMSDVRRNGRKVKQFTEPYVGTTFANGFKEAVLKLRCADGLLRANQG